MDLRKEEGLTSRIDSVQLVLTPSLPCMGEYKPRLSSTDNLVAAGPHDKHHGVIYDKLVSWRICNQM